MASLKDTLRVQPFPEEKLSLATRDTWKHPFVLVVKYTQVHWAELETRFQQNPVSSAKGESACLLCNFVNNRFWPGGSRGPQSSPSQDKCIFWNRKVYSFCTGFCLHFFFIVYSELEWMLPKNEVKKQHNGTAPLRLSSWAHPKLWASHFHMKPRKVVCHKKKICDSSAQYNCTAWINILTLDS